MDSIQGMEDKMNKGSWKVFYFFLISLFILAFPSLIMARAAIYDVLSKGSHWTLNVDGESGILNLLGGKGSRTPDGGWKMKMDIEWQGNSGILKAWADGENREQHVYMEVKRKNGLKVICEGYVAQETDQFMAGVTKHPARPSDIKGAWYATRIKAEMKPGAEVYEIRPELSVLDKEPPKAYIKVEGILVFTLGDRIKIRANAEDNIRVSKITIFIDGRSVKTCETWDIQKHLLRLVLINVGQLQRTHRRIKDNLKLWSLWFTLLPNQVLP